MIWSIISPAEIFPAAPIKCTQHKLSGAKWLCCTRENGQAVCARLISTDPRDYLNPALMPGRIHTKER